MFRARADLKLRGWAIVKSVVDTQDKDLKQYVANVEAQRLKPIFNSVSKRDKRRLQTVLPPYTNEPWAQIVKDVIQTLTPGLTMVESALIHSAPGCTKQRRHTDYDSAAVAECEIKPYSLLIAISDEAKLHIYPREREGGGGGEEGGNEGDEELKELKELTITLKPGDGILFRGDIMHAGAAYNDANTRLFAYLDSPEIERLPNATYFPPKVWCYCQKQDDHELYIECAGGRKCPFGGWIHASCAGNPDQEADFRCRACVNRA